LQDRVRELESEIEWVRAERQDAQQAAQREQKQAQARIKEAEDAAARAKAARRLASPATCMHTLHAQWLAEAVRNRCLGSMPCSATQTSISCPIRSVGMSDMQALQSISSLSARMSVQSDEMCPQRVTSMFRDEMKKINRDKVQLTERLKEAEGAQLRLDGEVHSLKSAARAANERHDASLAQMEKKLHKAQDSAQSKQDEVHLCVRIVFHKQISNAHSAPLRQAMCLLMSYIHLLFFPCLELFPPIRHVLIGTVSSL
jgi:predicted  nucleic acid-binding Zn-ribbon protein